MKGIEDLRTPLSVILDMEQKLRGTIAGFMMPSFVVDLPGGGGKRLAAAHENYDRTTGISEYKAPGLSGEKGQKTYYYFDPKPLHEVVAQTHDSVLDTTEAEQHTTSPSRVVGQAPTFPSIPTPKNFPHHILGVGLYAEHPLSPSV